jgi:hypothetical protein
MMNVSMKGWINERKIFKVCLNEWGTNEWMNEQMNKWMNEQMNEWMNECMYEWIRNEWMSKEMKKDLTKDAWISEKMNEWRMKNKWRKDAE